MVRRTLIASRLLWCRYRVLAVVTLKLWYIATIWLDSLSLIRCGLARLLVSLVNRALVFVSRPLVVRRSLCNCC